MNNDSFDSSNPSISTPDQARRLAERIRDNISTVIIGKDREIKLLITALIARGHVLMEDVPGTGKTMLAKALARSVELRFARVQFTPDLLPSDVTGMSVFNPKDAEFTFRPGPAFTNLLLADEINRATPRTQSALLEVMEESQVTMDGATRTLEAPFFVVATQNPVEIQGTFPLPEAQLDRFLLRMKLGYPSTLESRAVLERYISDDPIERIEPVAAKESLLTAQKLARAVEASEPVLTYIVALCERTRAAESVQLGVSTRGALALLRACQAYALISGRSFVTPDDVQALAPAVLAHRIIVRGMYGRANASDLIVEECLRQVPVPTEVR
ncbi:MAG: MoxR family ATPase [Oscillospiraceae bacterium]|jgi:MoxR-like ATPase|nr:MoxR family ATPase [Oscillospiraceae bacterium]